MLDLLGKTTLIHLWGKSPRGSGSYSAKRHSYGPHGIYGGGSGFGDLSLISRQLNSAVLLFGPSSLQNRDELCSCPGEGRFACFRNQAMVCEVIVKRLTQIFTRTWQTPRAGAFPALLVRGSGEQWVAWVQIKQGLPCVDFCSRLW